MVWRIDSSSCVIDDKRTLVSSDFAQRPDRVGHAFDQQALIGGLPAGGRLFVEASGHRLQAFRERDETLRELLLVLLHDSQLGHEQQLFLAGGRGRLRCEQNGPDQHCRRRAHPTHSHFSSLLSITCW